MRPKWRAGGLGAISEGNLSAIHLIADEKFQHKERIYVHSVFNAVLKTLPIKSTKIK